MNYLHDRQWSDCYIPAIKAIVGQYLLVESPLEVDQQQAADLMVLNARNLTIACRIRRPGYADRYPYQFTIRSRTASGATTELQKITNGWGDWMFYGHAAPEPGININHWFLINLRNWRAHMIRRDRSAIRYGEKSNPDGTYFTWFDLSTFPPEPPIILASSQPLPNYRRVA
ncbi:MULTISPECIES: hypothetical protein [unclassified Coleofasciculus]|uniref:hypothetical protein n=1 Tax=unclassified Coleofasciculus TaxID=2692782 RepID=UPI001D147BD7|nr:MULTISPECIES: hypothetical protein [unclassified Coleofasciculus]